MQVVLYIAVVLAGFTLPFFIKSDNNIKEKATQYALVAVDMLMLALMAIRGMCALPGQDTATIILMGFVMIILGIPVAKVRRLVSKQETDKNPNNGEHKTAA